MKSFLTAVTMMCGLTLSGMAAGLMTPLTEASAAPLTFVGHLSGANEIPPAATPGSGQTTVVLDPVANTLQINVSFTGLVAPTSAAHIHCCLSSPFALANVGVATAIPAFPGFPLGVTSGTYSSPIFDLTQATIYNPAFVTAQGGLSQAEAALEAGIQNGESYLNVHSSTFPNGEIRDFLRPIPEPTSFALLGAGLVAFGLAPLRRFMARS
jgi:hypothetical protein